MPDAINVLDVFCSCYTVILAVSQTYRMRKKIRGGFNFVVFVDDKDPRIFFFKNAKIHEIYYTLTGCENQSK